MASGQAEQAPLVRGLDALCNHVRIQAFAQRDDGCHDSGAIVVMDDIGDQRLVDFRPVHPYLRERAQAWHAGADVTDGDHVIVRMLAVRLDLQGCQVDTACNGRQGVDKAPQGEYDLVLLDTHMPAMDGDGAVRELREQGDAGTIVTVTASAMSEVSPKAIKAGCDGHISKPVDADFETLVAGCLA